MKNIVIIIASILTLVALFGCGTPVVRMASNADEQLALAKAEFDKKHWLTAVEGFQKVIFNFPGSNVVDTAQYYLALSYFNNDEYELAGVEFRRLMNNYPQSDYADEAQYMEALSYMKNTPDNYALDQEDMYKAIQMFRDFIIDNPDSPLIEDAKKSIVEGQQILAHKAYSNGMTYYKMYDYRAAAIYFQYVIDNYIETEYAPLALYKLAESQYKLKEYGQALEKFNNFITIYPKHKLIPKAEEFVAKITEKLETVNATNEP